MNPAEVVMHEVESNRVLVIFDLLGKGVRKAGESANTHTHRAILAFHKAGGDVRVCGFARNLRFACTHALSGTVARFWAFAERLAVNLHKLRVVDLAAESVFHGHEVGSMTVRGQLNAGGEPASKVMHEVAGRGCIALADVPARNQFGIAIDGRPSPNASSPLGFHLRRAIFVLGIAKSPNFVTLETFARQVTKHFILIARTRVSSINQHFNDGVNGRAGQTRSGAKAIALTEAVEDLRPPVNLKLVHNDIYT